MIIPVIIGGTGILTRGLRKSVEATLEKHSIDSLQKTAILGTSHIIRKRMQSETSGLSGVDHRWFKRRTRKKRENNKNKNKHNNNNNNNNTKKDRTFAIKTFFTTF